MTAQQHLITNREPNQLLRELRHAIKTANRIEIAVSFIRNSGLNLIVQDIEDAMHSEERNVTLSLLTFMNYSFPVVCARLSAQDETSY